MNSGITQIQALLQEAVEADGAIKGTLQRYRKITGTLEVIASHGFSPEFLTHFKNVKPFDSSCCGRAFGSGSIVTINDVEKDISFLPNLEIARSAGFQSVKSVPIYISCGQKVGVISTHFKEPQAVWATVKLNEVLYKLAGIFEENPVLTE
ncbi:MAG: GAF domain-containing protein [Bacteroidia bacterium]